MKPGWKIFLLVALLIPCWVVAWKFGQDLPAYYKVSKWLWDGDIHLIYAPDGKLRWFYYCPFALFLFKPFGGLSLFGMKIAWIVLHTLSYLGFWYLLHRLFPYLKQANCRFVWLIVWIAAINPIHTGFQSQNIQIVLALSLLLSEFLSRSSKGATQFLGGAVLAIAATVKLFPFFIVVLYLLTKPRSVLAGMLGGLVFSLVTPFFYFGWETTAGFYRDWIGNLGVYHGIYTLGGNPENLSLPSFLAVWLSPWLEPNQIQWATRSIVVAISLGFFLFVYRNRSHSNLQGSFWALGCALMALVNSSSRPDYFIFYVPAFAAIGGLWGAAKFKEWWLGVGTLVALALMAFTTEWVVGSKQLNNLLELWRVPTLGMMVLCVVLAFAIGRRPIQPNG